MNAPLRRAPRNNEHKDSLGRVIHKGPNFYATVRRALQMALLEIDRQDLALTQDMARVTTEPGPSARVTRVQFDLHFLEKE